MIIAGQLLLPQDHDRVRPVRLAAGAVRVEGGRIARVWADQAADPAPVADLGGDDWLIAPAFTDPHLHLPQFDSIGATGLTLLDWLERVIFPAEERWADAEFATGMAERVARQLLAHGTVRVSAYATVHHASAQCALDVLGDAGLEGYVGQVLMDCHAPSGLLRPWRDQVADAGRLRGAARVRPIVTPRFAVSCTMELMQAAARLAEQSGQRVQTHLAETLDECALIRSLFGAGYTEVYRRAGLLRPGALLAHGIHLDDADRRAIRDAGAIVAHCPTANEFLRSGAMDLAAHEVADVQIALGSDVAGGPDRSMVRVARSMLETAHARGHLGLSAARAWWQITAGNAAALGFAHAGRLEANAEASLVVIRPDLPWRTALDPLSNLLYAWDDRWLRHVMIAGRLLPATT